ncbi:MAG: peptidase S10 [Chloroflexaceae bacterium]|nr:peptidase S10 [Chloroflexaceae bacterium]
MTNSSETKPSALDNRQGNTTEQVLTLDDASLRYRAIADWQTLYDQEKAIAELFYIAYLAEEVEPGQRPLTFVFNGGPGAASVYLHLGALGPKRVGFDAEGGMPRPPVRLLDNPQSWLRFSDLVFVDPIGTGFSRTWPQDRDNHKTNNGEKPTPESQESPEENRFWEMEQDLNSLGEFMQRFLSRYQRWLSPIFIAGESYGGFRVAKMTRKLQETFGIGLSGAILISPALEFSLLEGSDYNLSYWATLIPSYAAAAIYHNRVQPPADLAAHLQRAEQFAQETLIPFLALGDRVSPSQSQAVYATLAELIGLPVALIEQHGGRVDREIFARELLREEGKVLGLYDGAVTAIDPFPDRLVFAGNDPTLDGVQRIFTGAINHHLRQTLKVETELSYHLLNLDVFKSWKYVFKREVKQGYMGAMDDLRAGMALNPYMQVFITHGIYDLVTTYFCSAHLAALMKLAPELRPNLTLKNYSGGHMFYTWEASRQQWFADMQGFYAQAVSAD